MSKRKKTTEPTSSQLEPQPPVGIIASNRIRRPVSQGYYIAHVLEEVGGRPVPGVPIKIMGEDPLAVGKNVAELIKQRYPAVDVRSIQSMPRVRLLSLLLPASYLVIRLEYPPEHVNSPKRSKAFTYFMDGLKEALNRKNTHVPIVRRRPKPDLATY
jgi:hypothetical protein